MKFIHRAYIDVEETVFSDRFLHYLFYPFPYKIVDTTYPYPFKCIRIIIPFFSFKQYKPIEIIQDTKQPEKLEIWRVKYIRKYVEGKSLRIQSSGYL